MGKAIRKPSPQPPKWFFYDNDNCWFCKNTSNCNGCRLLKKFKKQRTLGKEKGESYENS